MDIKQYIDTLFSGYEETEALADFKQEIKSNMDDRIKSLMKKGLDDKAAFNKAISELGDVSALADELSLKKRQEVFSEMYMKTKSYMKPWRMVLYILCGVILCFGIIAAALAWSFSGEINAFLGTLLIFSEIAVLGFVFLGLTQETAAREAMSWKRALWYVGVSGVFLFGIIVFIMTYFLDGLGLPYAVATLIPFGLPSLALGVFLILTEKDRSKPWVVEFRKKAMEREMQRFANPAQEERFGLVSGALWIAAIAVFIILTITVGIKFSWLAFPAGVIGQMLILSAFSKKGE
ncbi:permease prefix domain 1-containing protein [Sinanaerobacter chloroacetimidivorans]|jgi:hypothetical protein|uniref:Uncharacterized protein n=1 Tax=Sinanaerobacter chloroacetimidivorans TaxID=2818044 RepID=A0A8J7VZJ4_9FIRM|nr:permease prefix domain 1-containing protein [Sinanaerobacter chloroacetimidivorans]MBR0597576.1 hypothetical protein [Sinanaerobacter chloroacetimidivorans]